MAFSKKNDSSILTFTEIRGKIEYYCAYQDRCHKEVFEKMKSFNLTTSEKDEVIVYLIEHNFLNEERFAQSFTRGKHNYKKWGKNRIINELKMRNISSNIINIALKEINNEAYFETFDELANNHWQSITEKNILKKRKKFCDYFISKGWENDLIYEKVKDLEKL